MDQCDASEWRCAIFVNLRHEEWEDEEESERKNARVSEYTEVANVLFGLLLSSLGVRFI
jgi:hypothetical protein